MNLNIKFICLIYVTPYKQSLPIILYNILLVPTFLLQSVVLGQMLIFPLVVAC